MLIEGNQEKKKIWEKPQNRRKKKRHTLVFFTDIKTTKSNTDSCTQQKDATMPQFERTLKEGGKERERSTPLYIESTSSHAANTLLIGLSTLHYIYICIVLPVWSFPSLEIAERKKKLYLVSRRHNRFPAITAVSELPGRHVRCPVEKAGAFFFFLSFLPSPFRF